MSENEETSYKSSYDKLKAANEKLIAKMNSIIEKNEQERIEREKATRTDLIAKINALCPTFVVDKETSSSDLANLLKGMEAMPKENAKDSDKPKGIKMDPQPKKDVMKINGKELGEEYDPYRARYEKTPEEEVVTE